MAREIPEYVSQLSIGSFNPIRVSNSQAQATQKMSAELQQFGDQIHAKDMEIATVRANTDMLTTLQRQSDEFGADPSKLKEVQDAYKKTWVAGLPSELQEKAGYQWDLHAQTHMTNSTQRYHKNQDDMAALSDMEAFDGLLKSGKTAYKGIHTGIPEQESASYQAIGSNASFIDYMKTARNNDGSMRHSPSTILAAQHRIQSVAENAIKKSIVAPIEDAIRRDPQDALLKLNEGGFAVDAETSDKYTKYAMAAIDRKEKVDKYIAIASGEKQYSEVSDLIGQNNYDGALLKIQELRDTPAPNAVYLNKMEDAVRNLNPLSETAKADTWNTLNDKVHSMGIFTKNNKVKMSSDVTTEDLIRTRDEIDVAIAKGVTGLTTARSQVAKAIVKKSGDEAGQQSFWETPKGYDYGYSKIAKALPDNTPTERQAKMLAQRNFVRGIDAIPEEIKADPKLYEAEIHKITVDSIVSSGSNLGIPAAHIRQLIENPNDAELRADFDKKYNNSSSRFIQ